MNILVEPLYIGLIQTLISFVFILWIYFWGQIINKIIFKDYNNLFFNLLISVILISQVIKIFSYLGFFKQINLTFSLIIFFAGIYNLKFFYNLINKNTVHIPKIFFDFNYYYFIFIFYCINCPSNNGRCPGLSLRFFDLFIKFNEVPVLSFDPWSYRWKW